MVELQRSWGSTFADNQDDGIEVYRGALGLTRENLIINNSDNEMEIFVQVMKKIDYSNAIGRTSDDYIHIIGGGEPYTSRWYGHHASYVFTGDITIGNNSLANTVEVRPHPEAGARFLFRGGAGLRVAPSGYAIFKARGTADMPIYFGPAQEDTRWSGISVGDGCIDYDTVFEHVVIEGADTGLHFDGCNATARNVSINYRDVGISCTNSMPELSDITLTGDGTDNIGCSLP